jgi:hypothetical protein
MWLCCEAIEAQVKSKHSLLLHCALQADLDAGRIPMAWRLIVRTRRVEAQVESEARFWKGLFTLTTRKVCLVQR